MENKVNPSSVMKIKNEAIFRHQLNTFCSFKPVHERKVLVVLQKLPI